MTILLRTGVLLLVTKTWVVMSHHLHLLLWIWGLLLVVMSQ
jgi:hypothetical protein